MDELLPSQRISFAIIGLLFGALFVGAAWHYQRRRTWIKVRALVVKTEIDSERPGFVQVTVVYPVKTESRAGNPANAARPPFPYESVIDLDAAMCEKAFGIADLRLRERFLNLPIDVWYAREFPKESYPEEQTSRRWGESLAGFLLGAGILVATALAVF